jgi:hypothetical protein
MQTVSADFNTNAATASRLVSGKLEIDWDKDDSYTDETTYSLLLEIEKRVSEPLGGVNLSLADIYLANETDRFTPPATNPA